MDLLQQAGEHHPRGADAELAELTGAGTSSPVWTEYLSVGNAKVGMRVIQTASATLSTRYFHTDHLGSVSVITDETGNVRIRRAPSCLTRGISRSV